MTRWVCVRCSTPVNGDSHDPWCAYCDDDTLAVEAPGPVMISDRQYRAICVLFKSMGEVNRAKRMRRLSAITGRTVTDYWQLTATDADTAQAALRREAHGVR